MIFYLTQLGILWNKVPQRVETVMTPFTAFCGEARMQSSCKSPRRRFGNIAVPQRMRLLLRPWLTSIVWSACVLGCSLSLLLPSLGWTAEQAELEYAKGIVEYGKGNYLEALEHFRTAVDLTPDDANARFDLGLTQTRLGEFGAAIPQLDKALQLDPSLPHVHYP